MNQRTLRIPGTLKHTSEEQTDVALQEKAREHVDRHPGVGYLAEVLRALHAPGTLMRSAKGFYSAFTPRALMDALAQRPDLRVKTMKAITGGAPTLLRRLSPEALASQIDLLVVEDLPEAERSVRAEADRALTVHDLYMKYLDPIDVATYLSPQSIWAYESNDNWWKWEPTADTRALMASELRSLRRHGVLTDAEILDLLGEETLEQHLSLAVRTGLRRAARRAAAAGKPFTDADLFAGPGAGGRDLIDEMVNSVPMAQLREVVAQAGRILGVSELDDSEEPTAVTVGNSARSSAAVPTPIGQRIAAKPAPAVTLAPSPLLGKPRAANDRNATPPPKVIPRAARADDLRRRALRCLRPWRRASGFRHARVGSSGRFTPGRCRRVRRRDGSSAAHAGGCE